MNRFTIIIVVAMWCISSNQARSDLTAADILKNWTETASPMQEFPSPISWTLASDAFETTNGSASLISDFSLSGDFSFSTIVRPLSAEFPDNDLWGVAFGWQDLSNHYRLGWGAGGNRDTGLGGTGADGLYLVRESGGVGTILFNDPGLYWQNDTDYGITISRLADLISFSVVQASNSQPLADSSISDTTFMDGQLAFWVESQSTRFSDFDLTNPDPNLLFLDDFEQEFEPQDPRGFTENYDNFRNWDVRGTGVDLFARRLFPDQGITVDLDGTSGSTLITKQEFELSPGTYELQFDLGGPLGGLVNDSVVVSLGEFRDTITVRRGESFQTISRQIQLDDATLARISFEDLGADSNGAILDNVRLRKLDESETLIGDFDGDFSLTIFDLDELTHAISDGGVDPKYDVDGNSTIDTFDRLFWVRHLKKTSFGDANLDGLFNTEDLIQVFQAGQFADGIIGNSTWSDGDFGGDFEFDTDDLVLAFQTGSYEQARSNQAMAVPEPDGILMFVVGLVWLVRPSYVYRDRRTAV